MNFGMRFQTVSGDLLCSIVASNMAYFFFVEGLCLVFTDKGIIKIDEHSIDGQGNIDGQGTGLMM